MPVRITQSTRALLSSFGLLICFFIPVVSFAVGGSGDSSGLVPCGTEDTMCKFSDIYVLAKNIMNFLLFNVAVPLSAGLFTWAGILYVYSAWDPGRRNKAKAILKSTVIGLIIAFAGWLIVTTIISILTTGSPYVNENGPIGPQ